MPHQPKKPPTVDKFTNQLYDRKTCVLTKKRWVDDLLEDGDSTRRGVHERQEGERAGEEHSGEGKTILRAVSEEARRLTAESKTIKHTGGREKERVASGEGRGEDARIDDVRQDLDA